MTGPGLLLRLLDVLATVAVTFLIGWLGEQSLHELRNPRRRSRRQ